MGLPILAVEDLYRHASTRPYNEYVGRLVGTWWSPGGRPRVVVVVHIVTLRELHKKVEAVRWSASATSRYEVPRHEPTCHVTNRGATSSSGGEVRSPEVDSKKSGWCFFCKKLLPPVSPCFNQTLA